MLKFELLPQGWLACALKIAHQACSSPCIGVIALVPVHTTSSERWRSKKGAVYLQGLASSNTRVGCPRATKHDIMFSVKKVGWQKCQLHLVLGCFIHTCICWVELHRFEALMLLERRTSPFPDTPHLRLAGEFVSLRGHRYWMPIFEANISTLKISEKLLRALTISRSSGWWAFLDAVVDEVSTIGVSASLRSIE
jgi:hypothetical protein